MPRCLARKLKQIDNKKWIDENEIEKNQEMTTTTTCGHDG